MPERRFGDLIATGAEIPAWARVTGRSGAWRSQAPAQLLEDVNPAQNQTCFCGCVNVKSSNPWGYSSLGRAGGSCSHTWSHPCGVAAGGCWLLGKPRDGCAPSAGGQRGGRHSGRGEPSKVAHGKHPQGSLWESASTG